MFQLVNAARCGDHGNRKNGKGHNGAQANGKGDGIVAADRLDHQILRGEDERAGHSEAMPIRLLRAAGCMGGVSRRGVGHGDLRRDTGDLMHHQPQYWPQRRRFGDFADALQQEGVTALRL
ncbi:MAG: hypothetical protein U1E15_09615 [Hyphomicrobiales bacterium]